MSDKYILISRNRNVETDSDDHVVLGSYGYLTDASNAALSTKLSKREFLIVCDIADIHELTRKHVLLYSQDKFGRTKQVGNYEFSTWLCTWEGLVESNIDLKKIALVLLDLISREKPHDASRKECESAADLIREYCCSMQSGENATEKIYQYAYNATSINFGFTELSIHRLAFLLHTNDVKYILECFHYLSVANATNNEFFKIASSVLKRNFSEIELILSGKRTNMRVLQYNDGLP